MDVPKKILILYTELAGYTIACLGRFVQKYPKVEVHLVRWPVNNEAPFDFSFGPSLKVYERKQYDRNALLQLAQEIQPNLILCSGWIDKDYVRVCREWNAKIPVVLVMDNKWQGTLKQQVARLIARFSVLKSFGYAWVPGEDQKQYALRLGFSEKKIRTGFYSADVPFFSEQYRENFESKRKQFPHRFIYAGRYYDFKGVKELWEAFIRLKEDAANDWELWCLGTGDVPPQEHASIRHFGFVQPSELPALMKDTGVFILPSRVEPWGVAVHEFAAAGFPLLLSRAVGASTAFLRDGKNGFACNTGDRDSILSTMQSITALGDAKLLQMGTASHELAVVVNPDTWADTLYAFVNVQ